MEKLNFEKTYTLENYRVLLRPLAMSDMDYLLPFALKEPDLWTYSLKSAGSREQMQAYFEAAMQMKQAGTAYPFIVYDKMTGEYAGSTRFYDYSAEHNVADIGYTWYGKRFWGTLLNKNCKFLLLQFAFEQLGLDRVGFRADNNNARSIAAMKSLGCKVEGLLRSHFKSQHGRRDSIMLSILKEEWNSGLRDQLAERIAADKLV